MVVRNLRNFRLTSIYLYYGLTRWKDGILDFQIAEILWKGSGTIHGTDSSPAMIEACQKAAAEKEASRCTFEGSYQTSRLVTSDATNDPNPNVIIVIDALEFVNTPSLQQSSYTKAFSNAAMHWILRCSTPKQESFFRGVRESLVTGGTFAFEMGGLGNVSEMRAGLLMGAARRIGLAKALEADPWFFPDEKWVIEMMENTVGGWKVDKIEREWRPTPADVGGVEGWARLMGKQFFDAIENAGQREECIKEVVQVLEQVCGNPSGGFMFSYVRLRVLARKI